MTSSTTDAPKRQRRMAREPRAQTNSHANAVAPSATRERKPSKLDQVEVMLLREGGARLVEMMKITGWQQHSVRGAMAGALRKRGLVITSDKVDGVRRYRVGRPA
jgi:hypothetical protein